MLTKLPIATVFSGAVWEPGDLIVVPSIEITYSEVAPFTVQVIAVGFPFK